MGLSVGCAGFAGGGAGSREASEQDVFYVATPVNHRQDDDGVLVIAIEQAPWRKNRFTIPGDAVPLQLRHDASGVWMLSEALYCLVHTIEERKGGSLRVSCDVLGNIAKIINRWGRPANACHLSLMACAAEAIASR